MLHFGIWGILELAFLLPGMNHKGKLGFQWDPSTRMRLCQPFLPKGNVSDSSYVESNQICLSTWIVNQGILDFWGILNSLEEKDQDGQTEQQIPYIETVQEIVENLKTLICVLRDIWDNISSMKQNKLLGNRSSHRPRMILKNWKYAESLQNNSRDIIS